MSTPYQSLAWYEAWLSEAAPRRGETPFIISARDGSGTTTLLLPLVLRTTASVRALAFAGGRHTNINMPLLRRGATFTRASFDALVALVAPLRPDVDLFILDSLPRSWDGASNPLVDARARRHSAAATVLTFEGDPGRSFTAQRRRRLRAKDRKFAALGVTLHRARTSDEVARTLAAFNAQKAAWLDARGLANSFRDPGVMPFFTRLTSGSGAHGELHYLEAAQGSTLAVAATITTASWMSLMFVSFDPASPCAVYSPGEKLIRELIKQAYQRGLKGFDFGLGEAAYKEALGALPQSTFVRIAPLTTKGMTAAAVLEGQRRVKMALKANRGLLAALLRIRRFLVAIPRAMGGSP